MYMCHIHTYMYIYIKTVHIQYIHVHTYLIVSTLVAFDFTFTAQDLRPGKPEQHKTVTVLEHSKYMYIYTVSSGTRPFGVQEGESPMI